MRLEGSHFTPPISQQQPATPVINEASDKEVNKITEALFALSCVLKTMSK